jgi:hypothetical protein
MSGNAESGCSRDSWIDRKHRVLDVFVEEQALAKKCLAENSSSCKMREGRKRGRSLNKAGESAKLLKVATSVQFLKILITDQKKKASIFPTDCHSHQLTGHGLAIAR